MQQLQAQVLVETEAVLGECPRWFVEEQLVSFLDIERNQLLRVNPELPESFERTPLTSRVSAYAESGGASWVVATESGFGWLDPPTGAVSEIVSVVDPSIARMNDGSVDPQSRFWAGSASVDRTRRDGSVFMIDASLKVRVMLRSVGMSNGLGWLSDGAVFLHVDTLAGNVTRYDLIETDEGPELGEGQPVVHVPVSDGLPDGLAVDESDAFWLAVWGAGEVRRYTPDGRLDTVVSVGAANTTSCAFGGSDLDTLYITSARQDVDDPGPQDGALFSVTPGVRGVSSHSFGSVENPPVSNDG